MPAIYVHADLEVRRCALLADPVVHWIMRRVNVDVGRHGCWEWRLAKGHKGYPLGTVFRRQVRVHREVMRIVGFRRHELQGLHVDHRCERRSCVRPSHLWPVTPSQNEWLKHHRDLGPGRWTQLATPAEAAHVSWVEQVLLTLQAPA